MKKQTKHRSDQIGDDAMEKKFEKGSEDWQFFMDYWNFRQKWYEPEESDNWFEELKEAADELKMKYDKTKCRKYVIALIMAHLEDVDRRLTEKRRGGS